MRWTVLPTLVLAVLASSPAHAACEAELNLLNQARAAMQQAQAQGLQANITSQTQNYNLAFAGYNACMRRAAGGGGFVGGRAPVGGTKIQQFTNGMMGMMGTMMGFMQQQQAEREAREAAQAQADAERATEQAAELAARQAADARQRAGMVDPFSRGGLQPPSGPANPFAHDIVGNGLARGDNPFARPASSPDSRHPGAPSSYSPAEPDTGQPIPHVAPTRSTPIRSAIGSPAVSIIRRSNPVQQVPGVVGGDTPEQTAAWNALEAADQNRQKVMAQYGQGSPQYLAANNAFNQAEANWKNTNPCAASAQCVQANVDAAVNNLNSMYRDGSNSGGQPTRKDLIAAARQGYTQAIIDKMNQDANANAMPALADAAATPSANPASGANADPGLSTGGGSSRSNPGTANGSDDSTATTSDPGPLPRPTKSEISDPLSAAKDAPDPPMQLGDPKLADSPGRLPVNNQECSERHGQAIVMPGSPNPDTTYAGYCVIGSDWFHLMAEP